MVGRHRLLCARDSMWQRPQQHYIYHPVLQSADWDHKRGQFCMDTERGIVPFRGNNNPPWSLMCSSISEKTCGLRLTVSTVMQIRRTRTGKCILSHSSSHKHGMESETNPDWRNYCCARINIKPRFIIFPVESNVCECWPHVLILESHGYLFG